MTDNSPPQDPSGKVAPLQLLCGWGMTFGKEKGADVIELEQVGYSYSGAELFGDVSLFS